MYHQQEPLMDLGDPWMILSGLLIGMIGFMLFNIGRKEANLKLLATGAALCVYPYFIGSLLPLWLAFFGIMGLLYLVHRTT